MGGCSVCLVPSLEINVGIQPLFLVPTTALPTVKELSNALSSVTAKWHTLGVKLGLESCDLDTIQQNYPRDSSRCRDEMLACCRRSTTPLTWKMTVDALHQMGEHRLANRIRTEHSSSFTATSKHLLVLNSLDAYCTNSFNTTHAVSTPFPEFQVTV